MVDPSLCRHREFSTGLRPALLNETGIWPVAGWLCTLSQTRLHVTAEPCRWADLAERVARRVDALTLHCTGACGSVCVGPPFGAGTTGTIGAAGGCSSPGS